MKCLKMERDADIQVKYQKLATEYSKIRSQATVLKKAVLDEQVKNTDLGEHVKNLEQTIRIRDQEMESLLFRNEQLTKRIAVLQQELQLNSNVKKGKTKSNDISFNSDGSLFNEEFQKKIIENAQLLTLIAEKETEIVNCKEKLKSVEVMINNLQTELNNKTDSYLEEIEIYKKEKKNLEEIINKLPCSKNKSDVSEDEMKFWQAEIERWKTECQVLKSKPKSDDQLSTYYESQLSQLLESNMLFQSETKTSWSENIALKARLENITQEYSDLKTSLESSFEELKTTNNNYKTQLDAMTEHLAAQNEKITKQCDEIQFLKHKLSSKK